MMGHGYQVSGHRYRVSSIRQQVRSYLLPVTCCLILLLVSGCGYTTKNLTIGSIKTIQVDIFKNNIDITKETSAKDKYESYRPNLEVDIRDAIVDRIFLDGHLKLASKDVSDAILEGELIEYRKDPLRYQNEFVTEYRVSIICDIRLKRGDTSEVLLEDKLIIGDSTYYTTGSLMKTETQALADATKDLARRIVNRIIENW